MFAVKEYLRTRAQEYALTWSGERNPLFYNYTGQGGDCTNFISQCLLAGGCVMNFTPVTGWYYISSSERTASWTGVRYLYEFLTENQGVGPFATEAYPGGLEIGDVIQLGRSEDDYYHTLIVTGFARGTYLVSAHTDDSRNRPLSTYTYNVARFLHIEGIRIDLGSEETCFRNLLNGMSIPTGNGSYLPVSEGIAP